MTGTARPIALFLLLFSALLAACSRSPSAAERAAAESETSPVEANPLGVPVSAARREAAQKAVRKAFGLMENQDTYAPVRFVGDGEAALARDSRTGFCAIVYEVPGGEFRLHRMIKGGDLESPALLPPLTTRGTLQGETTAADLRALLAATCR